MTRGAPLLLGLVVMVGLGAAGPSPAAAAPDFAAFRVSETFTGSPVPPDLASHPDAKSFRTRLTEGARAGPNFAGHFTVVTWGCGTACTQLAIVAARTGKIFMASFAVVGVSYRLDSRLLVVDPPEVIREFHGGPCPRNAWLTESTHYEWTGIALVKVASVPACP